MANGDKPLLFDKECVTINLKWFHLLLVVVGGVLSVTITLVTLTNRYVDRRISYHMTTHEASMTKALIEIEERSKARLDARVEVEVAERKESVRELKSDVTYIRQRVDDIAMRVGAR